MLKDLRYGWIALAFLVAHNAAGGRLDDLEKEVTKKSAAKTEKKKSPPPPSKKASISSFGSGTYPSAGEGGESFLGSFWSWLISAPFQYQHDDPAASISEAESDNGGADRHHSIYPKHAPGQATVPYARVDYNRQSVDSEIDAQDIRIELGYKLVAFHGRATRYDDGANTLDMNQYYGVLRYGGYRSDFLPGTFEFAFGAGVAQITGTDSDSSGAFTVPIKYYPTDWFGIEFRPAWYRWKEIHVSDYDLSASVGYRFAQFRAGYRWLLFQDIDDDLSGPYAGVSLSF